MNQRTVKFVLFGDKRVGKTAVVRTLDGGSFYSSYRPSVGNENFSTLNIELHAQEKSIPVQLQIWDMAGGTVDEISQYEKAVFNARGALIVLDGTLSSKDQKAAITKYVEEVRRTFATPIYFLVNKTDHENYKKDVCQKAIDDWKKENPTDDNIPVYFCSAKNGRGITEAFHEMVKKTLFEFYPKLFELSGWEKFVGMLSKHKNWVRSNVLLIIAIVLLLILVALVPPVAAALTVGGLSALAVVGIAGSGALLLWNLGYLSSESDRSNIQLDIPDNTKNPRTSSYVDETPKPTSTSPTSSSTPTPPTPGQTFERKGPSQ